MESGTDYRPDRHDDAGNDDDEDFSLLSLASLALRRRKMIALFGLIGLALLPGIAAISPQKYEVNATFIPQIADPSATSGLAVAASQFGIRVPTTGGGWGVPIYVELMQSRTLLEPIAKDSLSVTELKESHVAVSALLGLKAPTPAKRLQGTIQALRDLVTATEDKKLGAVKLSVTTKWPSVSLEFAKRLIAGVNDFNLLTRKSQATAERQFAEARALEAEQQLKKTEDRLLDFLKQNRSIIGSPELGFERDRLQREVALRQQVYTTLVQNREEARIREVRDMPVITVLEAPKLPVSNVPRRIASKAVLGGAAGLFLGLLIAIAMETLSQARLAKTEAARDFFRLVDEVTPQFLQRRK